MTKLVPYSSPEGRHSVRPRTPISLGLLALCLLGLGSSPMLGQTTANSETTHFPKEGGKGQVTVTSSGVWVVYTEHSWIRPSRDQGFGDSGFTFDVSPNSGPPRTGTIDVVGSIITIEQEGEADPGPTGLEFFEGPGMYDLGSGWIFNGMGFVYIDAFPFLWLPAYGHWLYVFAISDSDSAYYIYDFGSSGFGFTGVEFYPFYFAIDGASAVDLSAAAAG